MTYEDIVCENGEHIINGFINSNGDLEYSIFKSVDGGFLTLENRNYTEDELSDLLVLELKNHITIERPSIVILGHKIKIVLVDGSNIHQNELGDEVYEIAQSILNGYNEGEIFVVSKNLKCFWKIIN